MVILPRATILQGWEPTPCGADCEGLLISFGTKLLILAIGMWAVFYRRSLATLPRVNVYRCGLLAIVFLVTFAYWLFYAVRILTPLEADYGASVTFALSLVDALLFIHYLAVILLEIRSLRPPEYRLLVVRSPDGASATVPCGASSVQAAAVTVLQAYYKEFTVYNPFLDKLPTSRTAANAVKKSGGSHASGPGTFKVYNLEGGPDAPQQISSINPQVIMAAAARKRDSGHNERFYDEIEWERRMKKRRARLITATEDAFVHVKRLSEQTSKFPRPKVVRLVTPYASGQGDPYVSHFTISEPVK